MKTPGEGAEADAALSWQRSDRMLLVEEIHTGSCYVLVLKPPAFIQSGEKYRVDRSERGISIEHRDGSRTFRPGDWQTCRTR